MMILPLFLWLVRWLIERLIRNTLMILYRFWNTL
ncbi:unnamed protein product [Musa acuminata subsp. malaccensis]|uniref:(wild Malaysian banana) hypothetical protein n=1 Tax=Musa acuminata subsp. malaccensis TaxID=214687 RepID=A0A804IVH4_MUSAM|nr:unnamed protein product [Musa acuminata subsp. malaccensis]